MLPAYTQNTQYKTVFDCRFQEGKRHKVQRAHRLSAPPDSLPRAHPTFSQYVEQSEFWKSLFRSRDLFLYCKNLVLIFFGVSTLKSRIKDIRKKNYFPSHFDGLYQLLFWIENKSLMKWCPGIINSKLNVVRVWLILNFILMIQIPQNHINYSIENTIFVAFVFVEFGLFLVLFVCKSRQRAPHVHTLENRVWQDKNTVNAY